MQTDSTAWGVLIADVVGSSSMPGLRSLLGAKLRHASNAHLDERRIKLPYAVTAGDEFQTISTGLGGLPGLVFDLRRRLRPLQLRIGIGIGQVSGRLRPPVNQLGGAAFLLARKAIAETKRGRTYKFAVRTVFHSTSAGFDRLANLVYGLHDTLLQDLTEKQWQAIDAYMDKQRVDLAARTLKVSISTASRSLRRGHFWQFEETIESMKVIIEIAFPELHENVQRKRIA